MFCQQAKPRDGVAKMASDGEPLFVTSATLSASRRSGETGIHAAFRAQSSQGVGGSSPLSGTRHP